MTTSTDLRLGLFSTELRSDLLNLPIEKCFKKKGVPPHVAEQILHNFETSSVKTWKDARVHVINLRNFIFLKDFINSLKADCLEDLITTLAALPSCEKQMKILSQIDWNRFKAALGIPENQLELKIDILAKSAQHFEKITEQENLLSRRALNPPTSNFIDNLLLAFSYFSSNQEPEGPWQALQMLQIYAFILVSPLFLSSSIEDLLKEIIPLSKMEIFFLTLTAMLAGCLGLKLYQKFLQPTPRIIKPLRNYLHEANEGRFDRLLGREDVIRDIFDCIGSSNRDTRQHPLLIGPSGVGKSSTLEEVVRRIAVREAPEGILRIMKGVQIHGGCAGDLGPKNSMSGNENLQEFLRRTKSHEGKIALILDEMHALIAPGCEDILKMMSDTGPKAFRFIIGTTTEVEYNKLIRDNPIIGRRFKPVYVAPTNEEQTLLILKGMICRQAPDIDIPHEILLSVYRISSEKFKQYNQPDISKRILSRVIFTIRKERESIPSLEKLQQKRIERDCLLTDFSSILSLSREDSLEKTLSIVENEIKELEEKCKQEKIKKDQLREVLIKQQETKEQLLKLATKIETQSKNKKDNIELKKQFAFLFYYMRPYLNQLQSKLEQGHVSPLTTALVESVINKFIDDENKVSNKEFPSL